MLRIYLIDRGLKSWVPFPFWGALNIYILLAREELGLIILTLKEGHLVQT